MNNDVDFFGESTIFLDFQEKLSQAAPLERPLLVIGERGSGKELAARRIHYLSKRWKEPLITLNCAALPPSLIETELFGHESGAFTGAQGARKGRFEEANNGTLFLDEIALIPWEVQEKILRVVEYGSFERVGSSSTVQSNVRIIGATNADLKEEARKGRFKSDLLDRLSFEVLFVPPLRYRKEDIILLAHLFANKMSHEIGKDEIISFPPQIEKTLLHYSWPGNVRELKNTIERAVYRCKESSINEIDFDPFVSPFSPLESEHSDIVIAQQSVPGGTDVNPRLYKQEKDNFEMKYIVAALTEVNFNRRAAAEMLGISYDKLRGMLRKYPELLKRQ